MQITLMYIIFAFYSFFTVMCLIEFDVENVLSFLECHLIIEAYIH